MPEQKRPVTEQDFRKPEYRDAHVEDYEFDGEGLVVRKDRWETALRDIRHLVGVSGRRFEIAEVVDAVRQLAEADTGWESPSEDPEDYPNPGIPLDIRLQDGSVLSQAQFDAECYVWYWRGLCLSNEVIAWRPSPEPTPREP